MLTSRATAPAAAQKKQLPPPSFTSFFPFLHKSDHSASSYGGPSPRSGGVQGWFSDQVRKLKNRNNRSAAGAYESAPYSSAPARRGFGPLDPDEAWDARVGNEADHYGPYEEQELGLHAPQEHTYGGGNGNSNNRGLGVHHHGDDNSEPDTYSMNLAAAPGMSRERNHDVDVDGYGARGRPTAPVGRNPFDDDAAEPSNLSLRGVSPRPMDGGHGHGAKVGGDSPTERRSVFTEQV